jgi:hypothetical protein
MMGIRRPVRAPYAQDLLFLNCYQKKVNGGPLPQKEEQGTATNQPPGNCAPLVVVSSSFTLFKDRPFMSAAESFAPDRVTSSIRLQESKLELEAFWLPKLL